MKVSVIIPVYNAAKFVERAVNSALEQEETAEVLLVEDRSPDNSLEICIQLASKHDKIKLLRHPDKGNHGAAATRNLGLKHAQFEYIAFLDADDFFLPGRFATAKKMFALDKNIDGVHEAIGSFFYDEESKQRHLARMAAAKDPRTDLMLTTIDEPVAPEALFETILEGKKGWFHFNGLTIKKSLLDRAGLLDEELIWDEDDEYFLRLAYHGRLAAGNLTAPVAMRGVHNENRTLDPKEVTRMKYFRTRLWKKMFDFMLRHQLSKKASKTILMRHLDYYNYKFTERKVGLTRKIIKGINLLKVIAAHPACIARII